jgi:hypothetical protein
MAKTKVKEIEVTKPAEIEMNEVPKLKGDQYIIGIGGNLTHGKEYKVSDSVAMILISKGFAKLKQ